MTVLIEWCAALLGVLVPTLVAVALLGRSMRRGWWPTLLWQMPYRPALMVLVLISFLGVVLLAMMEVCALANALLIGFVLCLLGGPLIALPATAFLAWWRDDEDIRVRAALIRNQRLEMEGGEKRVSAARHWPEYILDVQRARLRARYRPPD